MGERLGTRLASYYISLKKAYDESIVVLVADRFTKFMNAEKCENSMEFPSKKKRYKLFNGIYSQSLVSKA